MSTKTGWILFGVLMTQTAMGGDAILSAMDGEAIFAAKKSEAIFERVKALQGTWYAVDENGELTEQVLSRFEVTSGGNVVRETEFPGADHEMVTLYRLTDDGVIADHYCVLGNKPAYRVQLSDDGAELVYGLANADEVARQDEQYMGEGHLTWLNENRVDTRWVQFENGESQASVNFSMARKPAP